MTKLEICCVKDCSEEQFSDKTPFCLTHLKMPIEKLEFKDTK